MQRTWVTISPIAVVLRGSWSVLQFSEINRSPDPIIIKVNKLAKDSRFDLYAITIGPMLNYHWAQKKSIDKHIIVAVYSTINFHGN